MRIEKKLITPSLAKELLEANVNNRNVKQPVVLRYVNDMVEGRWKEDTAELIKISKTGIVLDGQHRLIAITKANIPISMHIAYDLEDSVFDVLDTGCNRNASDIFVIEGIKNASSIPSIIQLYHVLKLLKSSLVSVQKNKKKTNSHLLSLYYENPLFWDSVATKTHLWYKHFAKVITPQTIGGMYAYFYDISPYQAEMFIEQLCGGRDISHNSIAQLRTKLIQDKISVKKLPIAVKHNLIIKCWNHFRKNTQVSLRFNPDTEPTQIAI